MYIYTYIYIYVYIYVYIYREIWSALAQIFNEKIRYAVFFWLTFFPLELDLQEILDV